MKELDKLEQYLKEKEIIYERIDEDGVGPYCMDRHQLIIYDIDGNRLWDAICHFGSYGYKHGLLEVMGKPVVKDYDGDSVVGYLTADDVIKRLEGI